MNYEILSVPEVWITCAQVLLKVCINLCQTVRWLCQNCAYSAVNCAKVELANFALWLTFCCFHSLFVLMKFYNDTFVKRLMRHFQNLLIFLSLQENNILKRISACKKTIKIMYWRLKCQKIKPATHTCFVLAVLSRHHLIPMHTGGHI